MRKIMKRGFCLFLVAVLLAGLVPYAFADEAKPTDVSEDAAEPTEETTAPPETTVPSESTEPPSEATEPPVTTEATEPDADPVEDSVKVSTGPAQRKRAHKSVPANTCFCKVREYIQSDLSDS